LFELIHQTIHQTPLKTTINRGVFNFMAQLLKSSNQNQITNPKTMEDQVMKKSIFTLLFTVLVLSASAWYHRPSELSLRLSDNGAFNLKIGNQYFSQYSTSYTIPNLSPGQHHLEVIRYERVYNGYSWVFEYPRVVFSGKVNIPAGTHVVAEINHKGRFMVRERRPIVHTPPPPPSYPQQGYHSPGYHSPGYNNPPRPYYTPVMSERDFGALVATIANTSFDSNKLAIAKQAIAANYVTAEQVYELMMLFSFESNKLELAKYAYANTVNKERYFIVNNAFSFSSSQRQLHEYISRF